jgi:hypothetical protein
MNPCWQVFKAIISGALNELKELLGDVVTLVIETIEKHINCFFVQALQLDPKTLRLEVIVIGSRTFKSASQCAAYIGLVPIQNESGSSLRGEVDSLKQEIPSSELSSIWLLFRQTYILKQQVQLLELSVKEHNYVVNTRID